MIDGILIIDKEEGITSYDVIRKLKQVLPKEQKIGHGGTLDPFATGVLLVLLGRCTKLMEKIHTLEKEYIVQAKFGYMTDTQDITGKTISQSDKTASKEDVQEYINENLLGNISQVPPLYSAKKVCGQRAYDLAREGKDISLKPKEIQVKVFEVINFNWPNASFRIVCSSGTYVRTLINDLGIGIGTYATAQSLRRTRIGKFTLDNSIKSDSINNDVIKSIISTDNIGNMMINE
ncbi:MAG: tRNA pseudouridine(55) synthase TruB [Candidatus Dojkabacteria bacterium]|nr:tRNA pseudouridine(55) synthase TruB [Candidatus Dojkabacteria bacterium]